MARKAQQPVIRLATTEEIANARGEALRVKANAVGQSITNGVRTTGSVLGAFASGLFGIKPKTESDNENIWVVVDGKTMQVPRNAVEVAA